MKKTLVSLVLGLVIVTCMFAGAQQEESQEEAGKIEPVTINWLTHPVIYEVTGKGELFKEFTAETGITVEVTTFPGPSLAEKIPAEFIAQSDTYDVIEFAEAWWTADMGQYVEDLEEWNEKRPLPGDGLSDFPAGLVRQFRVPQTDSGKMCGLPHRMGVDILFYRTDLFEEAGIEPPSGVNTLEAYYNAADKMTQALSGGGTDVYGAVFQGAAEQSGVLDWYDMASPFGADILEPPDWDAAGFNNEAGINALRIRHKMYEEGIVPEGVLAWRHLDVREVMAQGKAALTILYGPYWSAMENPETSKVVGNLGYGIPPRDPDVKDAHFVRGWSLFINKFSKKKDAAWEFMKFLTSTESQIYQAVQHGNPPSRYSVFESEEYKAKVPTASAVAEVMKYATIQPNHPELSKVNDILGKHLNMGIAGDMTPEEALAEAERQINELIK
jgi:multiple sugar transport system substrate-binding protein